MSNIGIDAVRKLLTKYTFQIVSDGIDENLACILCRKLTVNPYQTHCGCIYCQDCVIINFENNDKYCSGGKTSCTEEYIELECNVFKSALVNRRILQLRVRCPNQWCECIIELIQMCEHLRFCTKMTEKCPYSRIGCDNDGISKDTMLTHLNDNSITHSEMLMDLIHNLKNEICELKDNFNHSKSEIESLKEESRMKDAEKQEMINQLSAQIREITERIDVQRNPILNSEEKGIEIINMKSNRDELRFETERNAKILKLEDRMLKQENELEAQNRKIEKEKKERIYGSTDQNNKIECAQVKFNESAESVATSVGVMEMRIDELNVLVDEMNVGTNRRVAVGMTTCRVYRFKQMKASQKRIKRPCFYSHANGYKLQMEVVPGGDGDGRGQCLSVNVTICQGEYDDLLEWPCRHGVTVSVVNQYSGENHGCQLFSHSTAPDGCKDLYNKPVQGDNNGCGCAEFISHSELHSTPGLIVGNALIIRCVATPPP